MAIEASSSSSSSSSSSRSHGATPSHPPSPTRTRQKATQATPSPHPKRSRHDEGYHQVIDLTADTPPPSKKRKKQDHERHDNNAVDEKRLRRWRPEPPKACRDVFERALTQRMFVVDRLRDTTSNPEHPIETVSLAGTTGNIYSIIVDKVPSCNCPHARKGNQCKHIIYVLARVLRAPEHLQYQLALLSSELRDIFDHAPQLPSEQGAGSVKDGIRKAIDGECPICCVDFEPESVEDIVYCQASCGNNIHKGCFEQWAAAAAQQRKTEVSCPFCRAPWQGDESVLKKAAKAGRVNREGYVNVARQLGISSQRDYSTYSDFFIRKQFGWGR